jgi:hypothetical protein
LGQKHARFLAVAASTAAGEKRSKPSPRELNVDVRAVLRAAAISSPSTTQDFVGSARTAGQSPGNGA